MSRWGTHPGQPDAEGCTGKKLVSLAVKRQAAVYLEQTYDVSERRACRVLALHRSTKRRQSGQRIFGDCRMSTPNMETGRVILIV
jgi:hypothetical protein